MRVGVPRSKIKPTEPADLDDYRKAPAAAAVFVAVAALLLQLPLVPLPLPLVPLPAGAAAAGAAAAEAAVRNGFEQVPCQTVRYSWPFGSRHWLAFSAACFSVVRGTPKGARARPPGVTPGLPGPFWGSGGASNG
jgi:hypothetical protein